MNNNKKIDKEKMEKFKNLSYLKALSIENLFVALPASITGSLVNNVSVFFWMTISIGTLLGFVNLVILFVVVLNAKKYKTMKTKLNDKEVINELDELEAEHNKHEKELMVLVRAGFISRKKNKLFLTQSGKEVLTKEKNRKGRAALWRESFGENLFDFDELENNKEFFFKSKKITKNKNSGRGRKNGKNKRSVA